MGVAAVRREKSLSSTWRVRSAFDAVDVNTVMMVWVKRWNDIKASVVKETS